MAIDSRQMEEVFGLSIEAIKGYLKGTGVTMEKANVAKTTVSSAVRLVATEANRQQMGLAVLRHISESPKEFKSFVGQIHPEMLPPKKNKK